MKIAVCIKEVLNSDKIKINKETKNIDRTGAEMIINPYDLNAVEFALSLKEKFGGETYVITMGIPSAEMSLRECLAMGIDNGILITDRALAGSDTIPTSLVLSETIRKFIPDCDLVIVGKHAINAETSIIGPGIAERLGFSQITYAKEIIEVDENRVIAKREAEKGDLIVEAKLPGVISVSGEINSPRYVDLTRVIDSLNAEIKSVGIDDLEISSERVGVAGSSTIVGEMHMVNKQSGDCQMISGDLNAIAKEVVGIIKTTV